MRKSSRITAALLAVLLIFSATGCANNIPDAAEVTSPFPEPPAAIEMPPTASPTPKLPEESPDPITEASPENVESTRQISPELTRFVELLSPLTDHNNKTEMNIFDLNANIPAKRVGETLTYDEFLSFIALTDELKSISAFSRESYDAPQNTEAGYIIHYEEGYHNANPPAFGYETYTAEDGETYFKPIRLDYNNDGCEDVLILIDHGYSEGYSFTAFSRSGPEGKYTTSSYITAIVAPTFPLVFGFFEFKGHVFFITEKTLISYFVTQEDQTYVDRKLFSNWFGSLDVIEYRPDSLIDHMEIIDNTLTHYDDWSY